MDKQKKLPIVVIGAGLSGLLTAHKLKKAGLAIKVLEARERAGGRIFTLKGNNETPLEMGATWFGNQHRNFRELLEELKLSSFEQYMGGSAIFEASPFSPAQRVEFPPQDPSFRIKGGTNQLIQTLLKNFTAEEIKFNEQVEQMSIENEQVKVRTKTNSFTAEKVICCIPPALMVSSIKFKPALRETFLNEARNTHTWMQESIKAGVIYREPFWKNEKISTIISNHGPVTEYYDHSNSTSSKFALCGFIHPENENLESKEREGRVIAHLIRLLGKEAGEYVRYEEVVWQKEKFTNANTGETFLPHQNNGNSIFQEPLYEGKVWISNSETSPVYGGYMEGAVYSANIIAKRISQEEQLK